MQPGAGDGHAHGLGAEAHVHAVAIEAHDAAQAVAVVGDPVVHREVGALWRLLGVERLLTGRGLLEG